MLDRLSMRIQGIKWTANFAYAVGLLTTDGNLSPDGRHLVFVSKDIDLIRIFMNCLGIKNKISQKASGYSRDKSKKYYVVQFGNVKLYNYLKKIGLRPNKSKNIGTLFVPKRYFPDFLRGLIDGDGHIHYFRHPESQFLQLNLRIISGSYLFLRWLEKYIYSYFGFSGRIRKVSRAYELNYYKKASTSILKKIYNVKTPCLGRKLKTASLFFGESGGIGIRASLRS